MTVFLDDSKKHPGTYFVRYGDVSPYRHSYVEAISPPEFMNPIGGHQFITLQTDSGISPLDIVCPHEETEIPERVYQLALERAKLHTNNGSSELIDLTVMGRSKRRLEELSQTPTEAVSAG